jgi:hypothetical protein
MPWTHDYRHLVEDGAVTCLLRVEAVERVLLTLDLKPSEKAVNDGDIDPKAALQDAKLLDDDGVVIIVLVTQLRQ